MSPLRNAWWLGAVALIPVSFVLAAPALAPAPSESRGITLRLNVVTSPSLDAVAGAELELIPVDPAGPARLASAGADGRVELTGLPAGRYRAVVRKRGFGDAVAPNLQIRPGSAFASLSVVLLAGDAPAGRVIDPRGRPVAGARVCVSSPVAPRPGAVTEIEGFAPNATQAGTVCGVSGADGSLAIPRIPYGQYKVSVEAPGYGAADGEFTEFRAGSAPRAWVVTPAGGISGRIVDGRGQGVAGVNVTFRDRVRGTTVTAASDANGAFGSKALAAGTWRVEIDPAEQRSLLRDAVRVTAGQNVDLGILRAQAAGAIAGRVLGADGTAVAGAEIRAVAPDGLRKTLRSATTDERGTFRLAGLALGSRPDLLVRPAPGFTARTVPAVEVPAKDLDLRVDRSVRVTGSVRAEDGSVPPRAYVSIFPGAGHPALEANAGLASAGAVDPSTGTFTVDNVPAGGDVEVRVHANGFAEATTRVNVEASAAPAPIELSMRASDTAVRGRIVDTEGLPVAGASMGRAVTDRDGRFELDRGDATAGKVYVVHPDYASVAHDFSKDRADDAVIVLDRGAVVEGTVTDADGQPVAGVKVSADAPGVTAVTGAGGKYRLEHVPRDSAWIRRQALGVSGEAEGRKLELDGNGAGRVDFRFGSLAVSGSIARSGNPVDGAEVSIQQPPDSEGGKTGRTRFQSATTDEEGRFALPSLEPGPARLTVTSGGQALVLTIDVPEGGATGLDLELPSRVIEGVLLSENGKPMSGAIVASPLHSDLPGGLSPARTAGDANDDGAAAQPVWSRVATGRDGRFRVAVDDPPPASLAVCTCAQGCIDVPLDAVREGDPVTLWFDPRLRKAEPGAR